ncbi:MAG TPA: FAD-linked oxidase C-terminal domain-containing protein, partial [Thermodesulfobacteriota bacterium]|nr:FAD-linked oxidase C-terminal domain-containing protein [Thermodesulfobacteriota bacterium]
MLSKTVKDELKAIVGEGRYFDNKEDLLMYSYDAFMVKAMPEVVLLPVSTEEVSRIMKVASREKIPVTPRGAGTNLTGGSVPTRGGMTLAFTKMNRILDIDKENRNAVVQPGVINMEFQKELAKKGLYYPPDPGSMAVTTMGGNVAENAGGPRAVKYGVTKDYLLGLEVVLASGEVLRTGGKTLKNVTGYNLTQLFCGSEGTLGLITEMTLKLIPLPETKRTLQAAYKNMSDAGRTISKVFEIGILPVALEILDKTFINIIEDYTHLGLPREAEALLLIEVDGPETAVVPQSERLTKLCQEMGAHEVKVAKTVAENDEIWRARRSAYGAEARLRPTAIAEDCTVPVGNLVAMFHEVAKIAEKYKLLIPIVAHAGDGNLHPQILTDIRDKEEMERVMKAIDEISIKAVELGGTLTGEHGIGIAKREILPLELGEAAMEVTRNIKKAFDPLNILNPD